MKHFTVQHVAAYFESTTVNIASLLALFLTVVSLTNYKQASNYEQYCDYHTFGGSHLIVNFVTIRLHNRRKYKVVSKYST